MVLQEQFTVNHSLDISPDAQHDLLRVESGFSSSLGTILRSPGSLALPRSHVIVDDPLFVPGDHLLQKRVLLVLFEH